MLAPRFKIIAKLAAVLILAGVAFEGVTRVLALSELAPDVPAFRKFRRPEAYAHADEDLYWWLRVHFGYGIGPTKAANYHPELGWTPWPTRTLEHPHRAEVGGRRPVLLFGDSFSACVTPPEDCFQGLMDRSELGATHALLNYGAHAYGLDQIWMLIELSIDRFTAEDPVVVVGVLVDRDLDRAALTFRGTQNKPRLDLVEGELIVRPPRANGVFPPRPRVLLAPRIAVHSLPVPDWLHELVCGRRASRNRNAARCAAILESLVAGLEARGLESFFLLFHSSETLVEPTWEDELITSTLDTLGARWVSTRGPLVEHAQASGRELSDYFDRTGHLNALGNSVAFRALEQGIAGAEVADRAIRWAADDLGGPLAPSNFARVKVGGPRGTVRYQFGARPAFGDPSEISRLFFSVDRNGPSEATYALNGRAASFSATARFYPGGNTKQGSVGLTILVDGETVRELALTRRDPPVPVRVDLSGRDELTLRVDDDGDGVRGDWFVLSSPRFEHASAGPAASGAGDDQSE